MASLTFHTTRLQTDTLNLNNCHFPYNDLGFDRYFHRMDAPNSKNVNDCRLTYFSNRQVAFTVVDLIKKKLSLHSFFANDNLFALTAILRIIPTL